MTVEYEMAMECADAITCSDAILVRLGHGPDFRLKADVPTDTVHGYVEIHHDQPVHRVIVNVYDTDQAPTATHRSTLKRPPVMPTVADIVARLQA